MEKAKIIHFTPWMSYVIAACLMAIGIYQIQLILTLKKQLASAQSEMVTLKQSNALVGLRLVTLEAKDAAYGSARIIVAWDPNLHRGVISLQNLPAPPAGHDYQLWVLDPTAEIPISAGMIAADTPSRGFTVQPINVLGPGFAISLEPGGEQSTPTGPILFAVAPEE
jgi:anti-sigma-K factor RskA